jgi:hypothetical protein
VTPRPIAFLSSSFEYTTGILPLVRRLERRGHLVHWISFRRHEYAWLRAQGVPASQILDTIAALESPIEEQEIESRLARLENGQPPYARHIAAMDRLVRRKPFAFTRRYLAHIERAVTEFLVSRGVTLVSGGRDTALQIATSKVCQRLGIRFVVPTAVRLPDDRYGFCPGYTEAQFVHLRPAQRADRQAALAYLQAFREQRPVPSAVLFEARHNRFLRRLPLDVKLMATFAYRGLQDRGNDFTRYTVSQLAAMYVRRRWNALTVSIAPPFTRPGTRPFVLYAYQMQPESGIDVLAAVYSDQVALVRQLARAVPATHDFYVKPHPDHVGGLSRGAMQEIATIPGVTLIDPFANGRALMHKASLIVTPSGTMAYEGALFGIPSIILADEFFARLPLIHRCRSTEAFAELIPRLLASPPAQDDEAVLAFLADLFANSFVGRVTSYLGPLTDEELSMMASAYAQLIDASSAAEGADASEPAPTGLAAR